MRSGVAETHLGSNPGLPYQPPQRNSAYRGVFLKHMSRKLLIFQAIILCALAILHVVSLEYYLYWRFVWLDLLAHTLGGMWAGSCALWMLHKTGRQMRIGWGISAALLLGIAWEIFEIAAGVPREANFYFDLTLDLIADVFGGAMASLFIQQFWSSEKSASDRMV